MTKGDETRTAILDEAVQVASTVGFAGLSIGRLADQAQMSKSGLFAHFRSKEQLQLDTLEHARRRFVDLVVRPALAAERGEQRLRTLFEKWLEWAGSTLDGGCIFVAATAELDDRPGPLRDMLVRAETDWLELLASVASGAAAEGQLDADLDPAQFAFEAHGVMLAHHHALRLLRDDRAAERARVAFEAVLTAARAG
ncbi:MAG: TetR/AcrR family transcriptional regulator [Nocardioides sp.]